MSDHATQATDALIANIELWLCKRPLPASYSLSPDDAVSLLNRLAQAESRLAVRQTDRECADKVSECFGTNNHGEMTFDYDKAQRIVAAHVASETEPWRKRCEEAEGLLHQIDVAWTYTLGEQWANVPKAVQRIRAFLATHPATGGGEDNDKP